MSEVRRILGWGVVCLLFCTSVYAARPPKKKVSVDSLPQAVPLVVPISPHAEYKLAVDPKQDTVQVPLSDPDAQAQRSKDSVGKLKNSSAITEILHYSAKDSIYMDMTTALAYLYNEAKVDYQGSKLDAAYMELDIRRSEVLARPIKDSLEEWIGIPHYEQGTDVFDAEEIRYNFKSKKGLIKDVVTVQEDLFVHGHIVKKYPDNITHIRKAQFTSCELDHPHFDIRAFKAKVIPDDKIIIGSGMMFIEDIPTPLVIPFAIFPNSKKRKSGIMFPSFGQTQRQGFFFKGLGYYFKFNDYIDLKVDGDAYTGGDWEVRGQFRYAWRYKFSGSLGFGYSQNLGGTRGDPGRKKQTGLSIQWVHAQDARSNPNSNFSANVNFRNSTATEYSNNLNDYITNITTSNVTYAYNYGSKLHLTLHAGNDYNTQTRKLSVILPSANFSVSTLYPFRRKVQTGKRKWYETIGFNYRLEAKNLMEAIDTAFFTQKMVNEMKNGIKQTINLSSTVKIFKYINWTNNIDYQEYWYLKNQTKGYQDSVLVTQDNKGFKATRDFQYNTSFNFKVYGIFKFKKGAIKAFRHVMTPSIGFTYRPDFGTPFWNNYSSYVDLNGVEHRYSKYANSLYGGPASGMVGSINFSLNNTFDMKVRNRKDTITGEKKVNLLDYLTVSTSYNMAADSLRWSPISISARTVLFKQLDITFNANFDFYKTDSVGRKYNEFFWVNNKTKGLRFTQSNLNLSFSWNFNPKSKGNRNTPSMNSAIANPEITSYANPLYSQSDMFLQTVDFSVPWSLALTCYFGYTMTPYSLKEMQTGNGTYFRHDFISTIGLTGDISITPKWKITFSMGYDVVNRKMTLTSINFARDLHCWEMGFYWVPPWGSGNRTEWNFHIRIRSSIFQDIKYEKRQDYRDNNFF